MSQDEFDENRIRDLLLRFTRELPSGYLPLNPEQQFTLKNSGNLILVDNAFDAYIEQKTARSLTEVLEIVKEIKQKASEIDLKVLFRGQTRDYYDGSGCHTVLPAAFRPNAESPFGNITDIKLVKSKLMPWINFLDENNIHLGDSLRFEVVDESGIGILRFFETGPFSGKSPSDAIIGILQHYGFPTYFIDISVNELVSLWFALNQAIQTSGNCIRMTPLNQKPLPDNWDSPMDIANWPCLMVYLFKEDDFEHPIIDLRSLDKFNVDAIRPIAQEAFVTPFKRTTKAQPQDAIWTYDTNSFKWPHCVIKLSFGVQELNNMFPDLNRHTLLPDNDPLYQTLLELNLPGVVKYVD